MKRVPLTNGGFTLVDDEDYERVMAFSWYRYRCRRKARDIWYVKITTGRPVMLHRFITLAGYGRIVDHQNGDGLDNRRSNLRVCSPGQNRANSVPSKGKRFKGVYFIRGSAHRKHPWAAAISIKGRTWRLGNFPTEEDAAIAYNVGAQIFYGEFAKLNPV